MIHQDNSYRLFVIFLIVGQLFCPKKAYKVTKFISYMQKILIIGNFFFLLAHK